MNNQEFINIFDLADDLFDGMVELTQEESKIIDKHIWKLIKKHEN